VLPFILLYNRMGLSDTIMLSTSSSLKLSPSSASLTSDDNEHQARTALARFHAYHTRPSTVAANEFLGITTPPSSPGSTPTTGTLDGRTAPTTKVPVHWETLPERVEKLCHVLREWVSGNIALVCFLDDVGTNG